MPIEVKENILDYPRFIDELLKVFPTPHYCNLNVTKAKSLHCNKVTDVTKRDVSCHGETADYQHIIALRRFKNFARKRTETSFKKTENRKLNYCMLKQKAA